MINLEQAAIACANSLSGLTKENENIRTISITFKDIDNYLNTAFKTGAKFVQQWISPKDEMPPVGELVQVKVKWRDGSDITYDHDKRIVGNGYDDFEINQIVELEVIGWRPIERK